MEILQALFIKLYIGKIGSCNNSVVRFSPFNNRGRMCTVSKISDKILLNRFFQRNIGLYIYNIGDIDDFFWPNTTWYGLFEGEQLHAVALIYDSGDLDVLLALTDDVAPMAALLNTILPQLSDRFYAHLTPGLEDLFLATHDLDFHGAHHKMLLTEPSAVNAIDTAAIDQLTTADLAETERFYAEAYPGNWFDKRMLETEQYYGLRIDGRLVSMGGIHVYSEQYDVAALGNIATHPDYRNRGYGRIVTAAICQSLQRSVTHIGLNMLADNSAALAIYHSLGFEIVAPYGEYMIERKQ